MFVQVMQGKVNDPALMKQRMDDWVERVRPGAIGFLGSTGGMAPDGTFFVAARFESPEAAQANSGRSEQSRWWEDTERVFDGEVTFHDCSQVDQMLSGGSDAAGFVQVIQGRAVDPQRLRDVGEAQLPELSARRPDILGGVVAWHDDDPSAFTQLVYFRSEQEARTGEQTMDDAQAAEWSSLMAGPSTFVDLPEPMLL
jgi:hypothetical protein